MLTKILFNQSILSKITVVAAVTTVFMGYLESSKSSSNLTLAAAEAQSSLFSELDLSSITVASDLSDEAKLAALAQLTHQKINEYRASLALAPLELNSQISEQARIHSENMANKTVAFSHNGFQQRMEVLKSTLAYRSAAENVAFNMGYDDPVTKAVQGWIGSIGHRQNMEGNYNLTGIGVAKNQEGEYYFTQIFILEKN